MYIDTKILIEMMLHKHIDLLTICRQEHAIYHQKLNSEYCALSRHGNCPNVIIVRNCSATHIHDSRPDQVEGRVRRCANMLCINSKFGNHRRHTGYIVES